MGIIDSLPPWLVGLVRHQPLFFFNGKSIREEKKGIKKKKGKESRGGIMFSERNEKVEGVEEISQRRDLI
jgi:hypothetical protein